MQNDLQATTSAMTNSEGCDNDLAFEANHASDGDEECEEEGDHHIVPAVGVASASAATSLG